MVQSPDVVTGASVYSPASPVSYEFIGVVRTPNVRHQPGVSDSPGKYMSVDMELNLPPGTTHWQPGLVGYADDTVTLRYPRGNFNLAGSATLPYDAVAPCIEQVPAGPLKFVLELLKQTAGVFGYSDFCVGVLCFRQHPPVYRLSQLTSFPGGDGPRDRRMIALASTWTVGNDTLVIPSTNHIANDADQSVVAIATSDSRAVPVLATFGHANGIVGSLVYLKPSGYMDPPPNVTRLSGVLRCYVASGPVAAGLTVQAFLALPDGTTAELGSATTEGASSDTLTDYYKFAEIQIDFSDPVLKAGGYLVYLTIDD